MRTIEFMKHNEARIIVYLLNASLWLRSGRRASQILHIDYVYVMKLLGQMFEKGWLTTHKMNQVTYYRTTMRTPIKEAKDRLLQKQTRLK